MSSASALTYYPAFTFHAHPLHGCSVAITAATLAGLHQPPGFEGQAVFFHLNHPIRHVSLAGILVSVDEYSRIWILHLDDGSGAVAEAVCPRVPADVDLLEPVDATGNTRSVTWAGQSRTTGREIDMRAATVGEVVRIDGLPGTFRGDRQVQLENLVVLEDPDAEAEFWEEMGRTWETLLRRPWRLETEIAELREEADGTRWVKEQKARRRERRDHARARLLAQQEDQDATSDNHDGSDAEPNATEAFSSAARKAAANGHTEEEATGAARRAAAVQAAWIESKPWRSETPRKDDPGGQHQHRHHDSKTHVEQKSPERRASSAQPEMDAAQRREAVISATWATCNGRGARRPKNTSKRPTEPAPLSRQRHAQRTTEVWGAEDIVEEAQDVEETARRRAALVRAAWQLCKQKPKPSRR